MADRGGRSLTVKTVALFCPVFDRRGVTQPGIEPATRHVKEAAHHGRIKLSTVSLDEGVFLSDILRICTDWPLALPLF